MPQKNNFIELLRLIKIKAMKAIANKLTPYYDDQSGWDLKNWWLRKAGIKIGKGVAIDHDFYCLTGLESNISIEDHAVIGVGLRVWNFNSVIIGAFSMFAADVTLANGGHDKNSFEPFSGTLKIGKGCWIGNGARIVGCLNVGDNAIVAAGSVVVKDVPEASIVAGVPARVIGTRNLPNKIWHLGNIYFSPTTFTIVE